MKYFVQITKRDAVAKVVQDMKKGEWCLITELANKTRYSSGYKLTVAEMGNYMRQYRTMGIVEQKSVRKTVCGITRAFSLWRKIREVQREATQK